LFGKSELLAYKNHENSKQQNPNIKQTPMTKTQNSKQAQWSRIIFKETGMFRLLEFRNWILFGI